MDIGHLRELTFECDCYGKTAPYSRKIMNCFEQKIYYVLRNDERYNAIDIPFLFIDRLDAFLVEYVPHLPGKLYLNSHPYDYFLINTIEVSGNLYKAQEAISEMLSNNKMPIVQTFIERLPHLNYYNPSFSFQNHTKTHKFLIVGEDVENYYCVEERFVLEHNGLYLPCKWHPGIGKISKELCSEAFSTYIQLTDVSLGFNATNAQDIIHNRFRKVSEATCNAYYGSSKFTDKNGFSTFTGKEVFNWLIYSAYNNLPLTEMAVLWKNANLITSSNTAIDEILLAGFEVIIAKHRLFLDYICKFIGSDQLCILLSKIIKNMCIIKNMIIKKRLKSQIEKCLFYFDVSFLPYLHELVELMDQFIFCLNHLNNV